MQSYKNDNLKSQKSNSVIFLIKSYLNEPAPFLQVSSFKEVAEKRYNFTLFKYLRDEDNLPVYRQFWLAAPHLLVLDFDDKENPALAEKTAFKVSNKLFNNSSLIIRSGEKGAKLLYASYDLVNYDVAVVKQAIEAELKKILKKQEFELVDFSPFEKLKKYQSPVRLLGLREDKKHFAHIIDTPVRSNKEYFKEQQKYIIAFFCDKFELFFNDIEKIFNYCQQARSLPEKIKKTLNYFQKIEETKEKLKKISVENSFSFLNEENLFFLNWKEAAFNLTKKYNSEFKKIKNQGTSNEFLVFDKCLFCGKTGQKMRVSQRGFKCFSTKCVASDQNGWLPWEKALQILKEEELLEQLKFSNVNLSNDRFEDFKNALLFKNRQQVFKFFEIKLHELIKKFQREFVFILKGTPGIGKTTFVASLLKKLKQEKVIDKAIYALPFRVGRDELIRKREEITKISSLACYLLPRKEDFCPQIAKFREESDFPDWLLCSTCFLKRKKQCKFYAELEKAKKADVVITYHELLDTFEKFFNPDLIVIDEASASIQSFEENIKFKQLSEIVLNDERFENFAETAQFEFILNEVSDYLEELRKNVNCFFKNKRLLCITSKHKEYNFVRDKAKEALDVLKKLIDCQDIFNLSKQNIIKLYNLNKNFYKIYKILVKLAQGEAIICDNEISFFEKKQILAKKIIFIDNFVSFYDKVFNFDVKKKKELKIFLNNENEIELYLTRQSPSNFLLCKAEKIISLLFQRNSLKNKRLTSVICKASLKKKLNYKAISHFTALATNALQDDNLVSLGLAVPPVKEFLKVSKFLKIDLKEASKILVEYETIQTIFRSRAFLDNKAIVSIITKYLPHFLPFWGVKIKKIVPCADNPVFLKNFIQKKLEDFLRKLNKQRRYYYRKILQKFEKMKDILNKITDEIFKQIKEIIIFVQKELFEKFDKSEKNSNHCLQDKFVLLHLDLPPPILRNFALRGKNEH